MKVTTYKVLYEWYIDNVRVMNESKTKFLDKYFFINTHCILDKKEKYLEAENFRQIIMQGGDVFIYKEKKGFNLENIEEYLNKQK